MDYYRDQTYKLLLELYYQNLNLRVESNNEENNHFKCICSEVLVKYNIKKAYFD